jgi:hypothetical protein
LVHKLDTFTELHRNAQQRVRGLIWLRSDNQDDSARQSG